MPPRFTYWTIILDGQPTAFRAAERDQLLPTLKQLQSKNPAAVLKWFAHGRLWESPEEVWQVRLKARAAAREAAEERRSRSWRPGGEHKDPREKFKKETFQARRRRDKKAADLGADVARPPSRKRFGHSAGSGPSRATSRGGETGGPAGVARVFPGRRSPEGEGGRPEVRPAIPAEPPGEPGRSAPSHKTRRPQLRKPR
jgi:hypothetical protein